MANVRDIARGLWIIWAILVWNVVFDHVIVVAGREYLAAAVAAAHRGRYVRMDDWMQPAIARGLWIATGSAALILLVGFVAIRRATVNPAVNPAEAGSHVPQVPAEAGSHVPQVPAEAGSHVPQVPAEAGSHVRVKTDQSEGVA